MSDLDSTTSASGTDPVRNTSARASPPTDSDVTTGRDPTISADPHTEDTAQGGSRPEPVGHDRAQADDAERGALPASSSKPSAKRENPDAIPTAGGEKLGTAHWGESKIVPDNPPRRESAGGPGVSSAAGQGDRDTRENTARNTGGATGGPGASSGTHEREGLAGKVMDKLHLGSHK